MPTTVAPLDVSVTPGEGRAVVTVCGEVDLATAPALGRSLMAAWRVSHGELAVDLTGVCYLDASGLRVLVRALEMARSGGGDLVLWDPSPMARRLLEMTNLIGLFCVARRLLDGGTSAERATAAPCPLALAAQCPGS